MFAIILFLIFSIYESRALSVYSNTYLKSTSSLHMMMVSNNNNRLFYKYSNSQISRDNDFMIRYTFDKSMKDSKDTELPPIVFIHGFGGNADQFRKNSPYFSKNGHDSYSIDLLVYNKYQILSVYFV